MQNTGVINGIRKYLFILAKDINGFFCLSVIRVSLFDSLIISEFCSIKKIFTNLIFIFLNLIITKNFDKRIIFYLNIVYYINKII